MERIIAGGIDSYSIAGLKEFFEAGFRESGVLPRGHSVLIKPNLLSGKPPEKAVTTHPLFLRALIELLLDRSCRVNLGDSPGYESVERVLKVGGYTDILKGLGVEIRPFTKEVPKEVRDGVSPYREFLFGEDPDAFDLVINVPKLKTHGMMGMTLGVKNTFGFIRGFAKGRWHLRAGRDAGLFAAILIDIHRIVSPELTILDGILAMCGDGPSSGVPIQCGIVAMSRNAFGLDDFIVKRLCREFTPPISTLADRHGLIEDYEVMDLGLPPAPLQFPLPAACATDWNLPATVKGLLRHAFVKKPKARRKVCRGCGVCAEVCPAKAIGMVDNAPVFDYSICISCYCCQEMCPHEAIKV